MKHLKYFLGGCVTGSLVVFIMYFFTVYIQDLNEYEGYYEDISSYIEKEADSDTSAADFPARTATGQKETPQRSSGILDRLKSILVTKTSHFSPTNPVLASERFLLSIVLASLNQMESTVNTINSTWGQSAKDWKVSVGTRGWNKENLSSVSSVNEQYVLIAQKCKDFPTGKALSPKQLFCLLTEIHDSYIGKYHWFIILLNSTYFSYNKLTQVLHLLNSEEVIYMGLPATHTVSNKKSKQSDVIHFCQNGPGIVLSRRALERIVPHLRECLKEKASREGDVKLGHCFTKKLGITCSLSLKIDPSILFLSHPNDLRMLENSITISPVTSIDHMQSLHLYRLAQEMNQLKIELNHKSELASTTCSDLSNSRLEFQSNYCNFSIMHSQMSAPNLQLLESHPSRLSEVVKWQFIRGKGVYNSEHSNPVGFLPKHTQQELLFVLNKALQFLKRRQSLTRVQNTYVRSGGSIGKEYILDLEMKGRKGVIERRFSIILPLLANLMLIEQKEAPPSLNKIIQFIIPLSNVGTRLTDFLAMYEEICLKTNEKCCLNLVIYGEKDVELIAESLKRLKLKYPQARFNLIVGKGKFSRGRALGLGLAELMDSDLAFICDVDMTVERDFLKRCERNTIQGKQVYFPEFFKYYDMEYVYRFSRIPQGRIISKKHGHWNTYSYGMLCIYKSDYISAGGYDLGIEGWGGEDVQFAERILRTNLTIFRAPDPALSHRYHDKVCSTKLTPVQFASCISSRNQDIADRAQLAEYVFYLENKCKIKHWKLWN